MKRLGIPVRVAAGVAGLVGMTMGWPGTADARPSFGRRSPWRHEHGHERDWVVVLPAGSIMVRVAGGERYAYCRGRYYRHGPLGYVRVPAPVGAVIPALPEMHRTLVIDGIQYHEYDGVYYKGGPAGYTVVPVTQAATLSGQTVIAVAGRNENAAVQATSVTSVPASGQVVVNVANKNGSYSPIALQMTANGMYIGPQGEIYPNLPSAQQLQALYGK